MNQLEAAARPGGGPQIQFAERLRRRSGEIPRGVELVTPAQLPTFTSVADRGLRGAPVHGCDGVECAGRKARRRLLAETLDLRRQTGNGKSFAGTLDLDELRCRLNRCRHPCAYVSGFATFAKARIFCASSP
jgi:hypothetical protein